MKKIMNMNGVEISLLIEKNNSSKVISIPANTFHLLKEEDYDMFTILNDIEQDIRVDISEA